LEGAARKRGRKTPRKGDKATRKKLCVGLARQFIVDHSQRNRTGRTTPEKLGLQMSWPAAYVLRGKAPIPVAAPQAAATQPMLLGLEGLVQPGSRFALRRNRTLRVGRPVRRRKWGDRAERRAIMGVEVGGRNVVFHGKSCR